MLVRIFILLICFFKGPAFASICASVNLDASNKVHLNGTDTVKIWNLPEMPRVKVRFEMGELYYDINGDAFVLPTAKYLLESTRASGEIRDIFKYAVKAIRRLGAEEWLNIKLSKQICDWLRVADKTQHAADGGLYQSSESRTESYILPDGREIFLTPGMRDLVKNRIEL